VRILIWIATRCVKPAVITSIAFILGFVLLYSLMGRAEPDKWMSTLTALFKFLPWVLVVFFVVVRRSEVVKVIRADRLAADSTALSQLEVDRSSQNVELAHLPVFKSMLFALGVLAPLIIAWAVAFGSPQSDTMFFALIGLTFVCLSTLFHLFVRVEKRNQHK
jgi:hypothetical protein